jgi:hypothetical protein
LLTCTGFDKSSRYTVAPVPDADAERVRRINLLTRGRVLDQVKALHAAAPGRFTWFNSYDVTQPDAEQVLTQAVKSGAQGFGEMKFHVAAEGPTGHLSEDRLGQCARAAADSGVETVEHSRATSRPGSPCRETSLTAVALVLAPRGAARDADTIERNAIRHSSADSSP